MLYHIFVEYHIIKQKRDQCNIIFLRQLWKNLIKQFDISFTIVPWSTHTEQQHLGTGRFRLVNHLLQIGFHLFRRKAAQTIIRAEFKNDDGRLMDFKQFAETLSTTARGFTRQAGIDHNRRFFLMLVLLLQQTNPAVLVALQTVGSTETVTKNQDRLCSLQR